jgi:hypothetical protein
MSVEPYWPDWGRCSNPPEESCADAGCPQHGWHDDPPEYDHETADQARADIERDEADGG